MQAGQWVGRSTVHEGVLSTCETPGLWHEVMRRDLGDKRSLSSCQLSPLRGALGWACVCDGLSPALRWALEAQWEGSVICLRGHCICNSACAQLFPHGVVTLHLTFYGTCMAACILGVSAGLEAGV